MAYRKKFPGYEENTMNNFKSIWNHDFGINNVNTLTIDEILSLKEAIARDIEAINFVKEISRDFIGSKNSLKKLINGESISL